MEMRLLKAASLFRNPDAKVINVAEQCGFNHLGLFNTCFKRRFGVSPGQWRKQPDRAATHPGPLMPGNPQCQLLANGLCPRAGDVDNVDRRKALVVDCVRAQVECPPARSATVLAQNVQSNGNGHRDANAGKAQAILATVRLHVRE
jgi:Helix-turn-helix domain